MKALSIYRRDSPYNSYNKSIHFDLNLINCTLQFQRILNFESVVGGAVGYFAWLKLTFVIGKHNLSFPK